MSFRPDREQLSRIGERYNRLARETESLRQKSAATTNSLARTFDRIVALLTERGFISAGPDPKATEEGQRLARIYSESDLLVAECLRRGAWKGLTPAELAGVVSSVVYESRQDADAPDRGPTAPLRQALAETMRVWGSLQADEIRHKLPVTENRIRDSSPRSTSGPTTSHSSTFSSPPVRVARNWRPGTSCVGAVR